MERSYTPVWGAILLEGSTDLEQCMERSYTPVWVILLKGSTDLELHGKECF